MEMKQNLACFLLTFAVLCSVCCNALYFHISETERKCFIEEIPDETMVIGKHYVQPVLEC